MLLRDAGMAGRDLVEDLAEEGETLENVRLVDTRDLAQRRRRRARALPGQLKCECADAFNAPPRHDERIGRHLIVQDDAARLRGEQAFGLLTQNDQVDVARPEMCQW